MVIVSHDLEVADYCSKVAILNSGKLVGFGKPKVLVESLPSSGRMMLAKFKEVDTRNDMQRILDLPGVVHVLHAGRNKLKIFLEDITNTRFLLKEFEGIGLELRGFTIDSGTFLDYFRIVGERN